MHILKTMKRLVYHVFYDVNFVIKLLNLLTESGEKK